MRGRTVALKEVDDGAEGDKGRDGRQVCAERERHQGWVGGERVRGNLHQPGDQLQFGAVAEEDVGDDDSWDEVHQGQE